MDSNHVHYLLYRLQRSAVGDRRMNTESHISFSGMLMLIGVSCMGMGLITANPAAQLAGFIVFISAIGYLAIVALTFNDEDYEEDGYYED
jgi:hypothetical protein